jgi:hypothetical protein
MEHLSEEQVEQDTVQFIKELMGKAFNVTVPSPENFLRYCLSCIFTSLNANRSNEYW